MTLGINIGRVKLYLCIRQIALVVVGIDLTSHSLRKKLNQTKQNKTNRNTVFQNVNWQSYCKIYMEMQKKNEEGGGGEEERVGRLTLMNIKSCYEGK